MMKTTLFHWYTYGYYAYGRVEMTIMQGIEVVGGARIPDHEIAEVFLDFVSVRGGRIRPKRETPPRMSIKKPNYHHRRRMAKLAGRSQTEIEDRYITAFQLRSQGQTLSEIGDHFKVCSERARQMTMRGWKLLIRSPYARMRFPRLAVLTDRIDPKCRWDRSYFNNL